jgi:hypothetical protein
MKVSVEARYYPNLIAHAFAVMGLANSIDTYSPEIPALRDRFATAAKDLVGQGSDFGFRAPLAGGPLFTFIYQIPSYLDVSDSASLDEVYSISADCMVSGSVEPYFERYPEKREFGQPFYVELPIMLASRGQTTAGGADPRVAFIRNMASFLKSIAADHFDSWWPAWRQTLSRRGQALEAMLEPLDLVGAWERRLGVPYPFRSFSVLLSIPDRTAASSVGPEAIVAGNRLSDEQIVASALHETGVRMFFSTPFFAEAWKNKTDLRSYEHVLLCVEAAACVEKVRIARDMGMERVVEDDSFVRIMGLEELVKVWTATTGDSVDQRLRRMVEGTRHG